MNITKGKPVVTDIIAVNGTEEEALNLACGVEKYSEHPLALAICEKAGKACAQNLEVSGFYAIAGYGAKANIKGRTIYVGKQGLLKKLGLDVQFTQIIENLRKEGKTIVFVGSKETIYGIVAIRDEIKPEAKKAIGDLHKMGVKVVILTGDNEARAISKELGIDDFKANLP